MIDIKFLLLTALCIYMVFNVITDCLTQKTYNKWHLLFILVAVLLALITNDLFVVILSSFVSLVFGVFLSKIPYTFLGAGDTKMLSVASMYLVQLAENVYMPTYRLLLYFYSGYMILSLLITFLFKIIRSFSSQKEFSIVGYQVKNDEIVSPEAIPIFLAVILVLSLT